MDTCASNFEQRTRFPTPLVVDCVEPGPFEGNYSSVRGGKYVILSGNASCEPVACNAQGENAVVGKNYYPASPFDTYDFTGFTLPADSSFPPAMDVEACAVRRRFCHQHCACLPLVVH